jgi:hypothetical protein
MYLYVTHTMGVPQLKFAVLWNEKNERNVELGCEPELIFNPQKPKLRLYIYIFFFSIGATTHCGFVFCSPLAGYSLLA